MTKREKAKLEVMLRTLLDDAWEAGCGTDVAENVYAISDAFSLDRDKVNGTADRETSDE